MPSTGRIRRIRVRSGPNPALLRLTILTGSSRIDTTTGRDIPGTYTCCTARYVGRAFRPAANRLTVRRVNVPVFVTRSNQLQIRTHASDIVAISAFGPGSLPLRIDRNVGSLDAGSPLSRGFWSATAKGDPRVDGYQMPGIDVLSGGTSGAGVRRREAALQLLSRAPTRVADRNERATCARRARPAARALRRA